MKPQGIRPGHRAFTLVEAAIFCALGALIIIAIIGLLHRSGHFLELSRRASSAQGDLRVVLETLAADVDELEYLLSPGSEPYDSSAAAGGNGFAFVIRSTRVESGLSVPATPTLRKVEYKVGAQGTGTTQRVVTRTVTVMDPVTQATLAGPYTRTIAHDFQRLRLIPVAAIPDSGKSSYHMADPSVAEAAKPRATVACIIVLASLGEKAAQSDKAIDQQPVTAIVTKLWCRNRMLELSHGGPP